MERNWTWCKEILNFILIQEHDISMDAVDDDENKENSYLSDGADGIDVIPGFGGDNEDAYRNVLSIIVNWIPRVVLI